mmetsp:Transcript_6099/g.18077  ORF Transcript_6099/g.18077 Transcript_6099/m.18077 type:complete len:548 (+) Transcript_6099:246-1889(+)
MSTFKRALRCTLSWTVGFPLSFTKTRRNSPSSPFFNGISFGGVAELCFSAPTSFLGLSASSEACPFSNSGCWASIRATLEACVLFRTSLVLALSWIFRFKSSDEAGSSAGSLNLCPTIAASRSALRLSSSSPLRAASTVRRSSSIFRFSSSIFRFSSSTLRSTALSASALWRSSSILRFSSSTLRWISRSISAFRRSPSACRFPSSTLRWTSCSASWAASLRFASRPALRCAASAAHLASSADFSLLTAAWNESSSGSACAACPRSSPDWTPSSVLRWISSSVLRRISSSVLLRISSSVFRRTSSSVLLLSSSSSCRLVSSSLLRRAPSSDFLDFSSARRFISASTLRFTSSSTLRTEPVASDCSFWSLSDCMWPARSPCCMVRLPSVLVSGGLYLDTSLTRAMIACTADRWSSLNFRSLGACFFSSHFRRNSAGTLCTSRNAWELTWKWMVYVSSASSLPDMLPGIQAPSLPPLIFSVLASTRSPTLYLPVHLDARALSLGASRPIGCTTGSGCCTFETSVFAGVAGRLPRLLSLLSLLSGAPRSA